MSKAIPTLMRAATMTATARTTMSTALRRRASALTTVTPQRVQLNAKIDPN